MKGLISGTGGSNPRFTGASAVAEFEALGGADSVPLETGGGQGTRESHWRKSTFGPERMTGFSEPPGVHQPLSRVSVASMEDLGYEVDLDAADAYTLGQALTLDGGALQGWNGWGHDHVIVGPVRVLERDGRTWVVDLARTGGPW
jgi:hypothetical protein